MPHPPPRTVFFVDGFNLYHSIAEAAKLLPNQQLKWLDLTSFCASYLHQIGNGAILSDIHYFTAFADHLLIRHIFAFPFARASKELKQLSNHSFTMSKEVYAKFQLPEKVRLPSGKYVHIPDAWKV